MRLSKDPPEGELPRYWREHMIAETCRFIEWGLENPDKVEWIPTHPVGRGGFSERAKLIFWTLVAQNDQWPDS